jgi:hypothetical protein
MIASHKEKTALINDILSVINNAETASMKAIMSFAPYVNEKGRALPFLCKTTSDFSLLVEADEYKTFLGSLSARLYPAYLTPKMDFAKAVSVICNSIQSGNFVAYDYANFLIEQFENDAENARLVDSLLKSLSQTSVKFDFATVQRTKGEASYYAYQLNISLKNKIGLRSSSAAKA